MLSFLQTRGRNLLIDLLQSPWVRYGVPIAVGLALILLSFFADIPFFRPRLGNSLDVVLSPTTFAITTMVFLNQFKRQLEQSLPKFLFVDFLFGRRIIMRIEDAKLMHEGDIRNWAQQVGMQMNNTRNLRIASLSTPRQEILARNGGRINRYTIRILLTDLPERHRESFPETAPRMIVRTQVGLEMRESIRDAIDHPDELTQID